LRSIGFLLILTGIVAIYLAVQGKMMAAFTALLTGQTPAVNTNPDIIAAAQNAKQQIQNDPKLSAIEKKYLQNQVDNFYKNDPLAKGSLPNGSYVEG
jgi:hypothetical protein